MPEPVRQLDHKQFQAPSGICRYCGCTHEQRCMVPSPYMPGVEVECGWADPRCTVCSAPACAKQYRALQLDTLRVMVRRHCICGRPKSMRHVLCPTCWEQLPWQMSAPLYEPISRGLSVYYAEAVAYLNAVRSATEEATQ